MATLTQQINNDSVAPNVTKIDQKIEVTIFPVADVDRAKALYLRLGWRLDADFSFPGLRIVQVTPHGSACSLQFGTNLTAAAPGRQGVHHRVRYRSRPQRNACGRDLSTPGLRDAWNADDWSRFHGWDKRAESQSALPPRSK